MNNSKYEYDVIVIGGGHAGIEAAYAAAKMGSTTLLATLKLETIGLMPCNPAIGGVGKGHLVYEISALGGLMPKLCSQTYIQCRMLNTRKGPAVQGLRLQIDKEKYRKLSRQMLEKVENLTLKATAVETILLDEQKQVCGITTEDGHTITAPTVIITTGTFLNGKVIIGDKVTKAGRRQERAVSGLAEFLYGTGLKMGKLKTGTPPRLLKTSIDISVMEHQEPDELNYLFEFEERKATSTHACYITHTNAKTHQVIKDNLDKSPLYSGCITGLGPRYCPSIEDKIARFPDKESHHVFVEPEGADHDEVYPNGISTSMPIEVQEQYIRSIKGFEKAVIAKAGYAVEYDFVVPNQLHESLEVKRIPGLFLAGQINGTTGYEEAAAQGLIAGINAHLKIKAQEPFILDRTQSYIGVMINDLTSMGVDEPYRMFTSRAERRLILRQDNVFLRLMPKAHKLGLIDGELYQKFITQKEAIEQTLAILRKKYQPAQLIQKYGQEMPPKKAFENETGIALSDRAELTVHAEIRYEPYIKREAKQAERSRFYDSIKIPDNFNFSELPGLSKELQEKLIKHQPQTVAQAALIPGMTPAALSLLMFQAKVASDH